jgi:DNA-directed RNA polymerase specialized sigma24 family protein
MVLVQALHYFGDCQVQLTDERLQLIHDNAIARNLLRGFRSNIYDADDLVQDAWVARLTTGQWPRRAMVDALRRWYGATGKSGHTFRAPAVELPISLARHDNVDDRILQQERTEILKRRIRKLPRKIRIIGEMYFIDGKAQNEIAGCVGCTGGYISQKIKALTARLQPMKG